ncbi:MAG: cysteine desulfurase [Myxococcales bacterium FL481]|nr:MAG: cysteine desulfurase [Myxococcales bacterium FL481]
MGTSPEHRTMSAIYLDHNATTPVASEVVAKMRPWLETRFGNPSSGYPSGREAAEAVEEARAHVARLIGAEPEEIVFTSGGTESNNWALFGGLPATSPLVISQIEHPAVAEPARVLARRGHALLQLPVTREGRVDPSALRDCVGSATPGLVSVMLAHNETGIVQPIAEVSRQVRALNRGTLVHTDAAQAIGKIAVRVRELDVDLLTIAGHKFGAPKGVGALYVKHGTRLEPLLYGGGQQGGRRPGTEAVAQIVALGAAAELAGRELAERGRKFAALRARLWQQLLAGVDGLWWFGADSDVPLLPNTLFCCFPGCEGADLLARAPSVAASTGSACHTHDGPSAGVLQRMGVSAERQRGVVRLSVGRGTEQTDVDAAAAALTRAWREIPPPGSRSGDGEVQYDAHHDDPAPARARARDAGGDG